MTPRKSSKYSKLAPGVMDDDTVTHLGVKVDEDSVAQHICLHANTWQKGVALSCWLVDTFDIEIIQQQRLDTVVRGECVALPELHERVFLVQVVHRVWEFYRLCKVSEILLKQNQSFRSTGAKYTSDGLPQTVSLAIDALQNILNSCWPIAVLLEVVKPLWRLVVLPVIAQFILKKYISLKFSI